MLRRYAYLVYKEGLVAVRNHFLAILAVVAAMYIGIMRLAIPADPSVSQRLFVAADSGQPATQAALQALGAAGDGSTVLKALASREEVLAAMAADAGSIGVVVHGPASPEALPSVELLFQGHESERARNLLRLAIEDRLRAAMSGTPPAAAEVVALAPAESAKIPLNQHVLPLFLLSEAALLGLFLISALVFVEKAEGTLRAYRVSPGGVAELLAAKITIMVAMGILFAAILTPAIVGRGPRYGQVLVLVALGGVSGSALGLTVAAFFDDVTGSTLWLMGVALVLALPGVSYTMPGFAPAYVRALPTYPLVFALRDALFGPGAAPRAFLILAAWAIAAFLVAVRVYHWRLTQE